ncbi:MAG: dihydroxyacetone kinase subunit DhaK [Anaerolineae bacterium]|nr:dihydroxyacetone kinase subunit DhaK [Chloroflexota bacterium]
MKKIINQPMDFVDEMLEGLLLAHGGALKAAEADSRVILRADAPVAGKVAILTGGGSGHLPVFLGYVGEGLADACSVGNVFSSPSAETMYEATLAANGGAGCLYLYGNYQGDTMNFDMAAEMAAMDDIRVETVLVSDDVASAPAEEWERRRGVAGLFFAYKIAGAAAAEGADLDEVVRLTRAAVYNTRSMGVALAPCTVPAAGVPTFTIADDEMEIGMGIHGEAGVHRGKLESADAIADRLVAELLPDLPFEKGDSVAVLVNGLGATPPEELYVLYRRVHQILDGAGISIHRSYVGEYATSLEMAGASVTLLKLDAELTRLLDAPARSPFFEQSQGA